MKITEARPYVVKNLKYALNPSSIAVVGASRYPNKDGNAVIANCRSGAIRVPFTRSTPVRTRWKA